MCHRVVQQPLNITWPQGGEHRYVCLQPSVPMPALIPQEGIWNPQQARIQTNLVLRAAQIARDEKAHFLIYPEYSVPPAIWPQLERYIEDDYPDNTVVIAGLGAVRGEDYRLLVNGDATAVGVSSTLPPGFEWANCCVVWAKECDGAVRRFVQRKMRPAKPEQSASGMYSGDTLFAFQVGSFCFGIAICIDLAANLGPYTFPQWIGAQTARLDALIWVQHNPEPDDRRFLDAAQTLLFGGNVHSIIAVNTAARADTGVYFRMDRFRLSADPLGVYHLRKVPEHEIFQARFRNQEPSLLTFTYGLPAPDGGINLPFPLLNPYERPINGKRGRIGEPCRPDPHVWAVGTVGPGCHPRNDTDKFCPEVQTCFEQCFDKALSHLKALSRAKWEERLQVLFTGTYGPKHPGDRNAVPREPCEWSKPQRDSVGDLIRSAAILHLGGSTDLKKVEPTVTAQLGWGGKWKVAVLAGDPARRVKTTLTQYRSSLGEQPVVGGTIGLVARSRDLPERLERPVPVRTVAEEALAQKPKVAQIDNAASDDGGGRPPSPNVRVDDVTMRIPCCTLPELETCLGQCGDAGAISIRLADLLARISAA